VVIRNDATRLGEASGVARLSIDAVFDNMAIIQNKLAMA